MHTGERAPGGNPVQAHSKMSKGSQRGTDSLQSIFLNDAKSPGLICKVKQTHRAMVYNQSVLNIKSPFSFDKIVFVRKARQLVTVTPFTRKRDELSKQIICINQSRPTTAHGPNPGRHLLLNSL